MACAKNELHLKYFWGPAVCLTYQLPSVIYRKDSVLAPATDNFGAGVQQCLCMAHYFLAARQVDELLVGIVTQVRLRRKFAEKRGGHAAKVGQY